MRYFFFKLVPGLLLASLLSGTAAAQGRIATVDLRKIFEGYWKTKQADAALKERATDMEKEYKNMLSDYDKAKEEYQKLLTSANDQAVSTEERDRRKKSAEDKLKYLKDQEDGVTQYRRQATATIDEQKRRMHDNILSEITNMVNAKAKAAGYSMVVDSAAESTSGARVVLYTDNANDLSSAVLDQLNAGAPADAAKPDPKLSDKKDQKKK